jgi:hypothetical protein
MRILCPDWAYARITLEVSHRAYMFEVGRITLDGESYILSDDQGIKKAYLGAKPRELPATSLRLAVAEAGLGALSGLVGSVRIPVTPL